MTLPGNTEVQSPDAEQSAPALEETPPPPRAGRFTWVIPIATVFVSSLCIMVVELVAGRLIARHVGSSLYTWTSVIGIVLSGIAAGNYAGGLIADRYRPREALASLFLIASATCLLIPLLNDRVGQWDALRGMEWATRIALHVFCVFFLPSALMGTISPVAAKMALEISKRTGRTVGSIYSWGAVGSIVGTFLTGYFLIAKMGTISVLLSVSAILLVMAMLFAADALLPYLWGGVLGAAIFTSLAPFPWAYQVGERLGLREYADDYIFFQEESQYSFIRVQEEIDMPGTRSMTLDYLIHAYVVMDDPDDLQYEYETIYADVSRHVIESWTGERKPRALFLGGGGFVFPQWMLRHFPGSYAEVAELDPAVTRAAFASFGLPRDTPLQIHNLDARNHVDDLLFRLNRGEAVEKFDFIYGDAFNHYSPPFHLTTHEFNEKVKQLMSPDGVFLANVIDIYRTGKFLGAMINTFEKSFAHVYVFSTVIGGPSDEDDRDTFVVVGSDAVLPLSRRTWDSDIGDLLDPTHLAKLRQRSDSLVLTDDFAPVDNLLEPVIRLAEKQ